MILSILDCSSFGLILNPLYEDGQDQDGSSQGPGLIPPYFRLKGLRGWNTEESLNLSRGGDTRANDFSKVIQRVDEIPGKLSS
jgi:hypothetical protein